MQENAQVRNTFEKPASEVLIAKLSAGAAERLELSGFNKMSDEGERISLNLGYTKSGFAEKVYHIHLRLVGDNDELHFRDYLNAHPQTAKEYEALKLRLWKQFEHDRNAYTDAKSEFIKAVTARARANRE